MFHRLLYSQLRSLRFDLYKISVGQHTSGRVMPQPVDVVEVRNLGVLWLDGIELDCEMVAQNKIGARNKHEINVWRALSPRGASVSAGGSMDPLYPYTYHRYSSPDVGLGRLECRLAWLSP